MFVCKYDDRITIQCDETQRKERKGEINDNEINGTSGALEMLV